MKLLKDPKVEKLTEENFIPRGAIIVYTEWFNIITLLLKIKYNLM